MKSSSIAVAVLLGLAGAAPAAAEPTRLAQTFAADVIPPYEVFTIVRSMGLRPLGRPHFRGRHYILHAVDRRGEEVRVVVDAHAARVVSVTPLDRQSAAEYSGPPAHRRYDSGPPGPRVIEADPRYGPADLPQQRPQASDPRFSAPQAAPQDDDEIEPGDQPDEFDSDEDDSDTGSLPSRDTPRSIGAPRTAPAIAAPITRSAAVSPSGTPLPRPRPEHLASAASAEKPDTPAAKMDSAVTADIKSEPKTEAPKPGIRIIEIKKPEPRI